LDEAAAPEGQMTWNNDGYYDVSFAINKSRRYHAKMRAFYQSCHDYTTAATAISGASGFIAVLAQSSRLAAGLTAIVAIASTLDLVFGFDKKAAIYDGLCRRFTELASQIEGWRPTPENLTKARERRLQIEADEPTERRIVDLMAQNEECRARGVSSDELLRISRLQRMFGYVFTFGLKRIEDDHTHQMSTHAL
jgi:hypothetical protein